MVLPPGASVVFYTVYVHSLITTPATKQKAQLLILLPTNNTTTTKSTNVLAFSQADNHKGSFYCILVSFSFGSIIHQRRRRRRKSGKSIHGQTHVRLTILDVAQKHCIRPSRPWFKYATTTNANILRILRRMLSHRIRRHKHLYTSCSVCLYCGAV